MALGLEHAGPCALNDDESRYRESIERSAAQPCAGPTRRSQPAVRRSGFVVRTPGSNAREHLRAAYETFT